MSVLIARAQPIFESALHTTEDFAKKYVPEPYYSQATSYRSAAEKYATDTIEKVQKTRADYDKLVSGAQEKAITVARSSYETYVPPPVKATVDTVYNTATATANVLSKRASDTRAAVVKSVEDTQHLAFVKTDEARKLVLAKADEAQKLLMSRAVEVGTIATSAYKTAEPYLAPVQQKAFELIKTYHIDDRVKELVQTYHLDTRVAEVVAYAEKSGLPIPAVVKAYLPAPADPTPAVVVENGKENGVAH